MNSLAPLSQITLYVLLALMGLLSLIIWGWQIQVLRGKDMKNPDGSADNWHEPALPETENHPCLVYRFSFRDSGKLDLLLVDPVSL